MKQELRILARAGASIGTLALAFASSAALAQQENAASGSGTGSAIEEIIVTAQRSEAKLQDTPLSIVAIGGPELEKQGTDSLSGFDTFVPNVTIGGTAAQGNAIVNVAIRGIGGAPQGFITQEGSVGIYIDDILFARPNGALLDLLDVERVEVLRGGRDKANTEWHTKARNLAKRALAEGWPQSERAELAEMLAQELPKAVQIDWKDERKKLQIALLNA